MAISENRFLDDSPFAGNMGRGVVDGEEGGRVPPPPDFLAPSQFVERGDAGAFLENVALSWKILICTPCPDRVLMTGGQISSLSAFWLSSTPRQNPWRRP